MSSMYSPEDLVIKLAMLFCIASFWYPSQSMSSMYSPEYLVSSHKDMYTTTTYSRTPLITKKKNPTWPPHLNFGNFLSI